MDPNHSAAIELLQAAVKQGGAVELTVESDSMAPLIPQRSVITLEPVSACQIRFGDCAVFSVNDELWVHRLLGGDRARTYFRSKGDNRIYFDGRIPTSAIVGRVINVRLPDGRNVTRNYTVNTVVGACSFAIGCAGALFRRFRGR